MIITVKDKQDKDFMRWLSDVSPLHIVVIQP